MKGRFCPNGDLCHLRSDGGWQVIPKVIRKSRGIGELFETLGIPTESQYAMKDLLPDAPMESDGSRLVKDI